MPNLFPIRAKFLSAPTSKRLSNLSCLELRKEIQEASRRNLKMNLIWNQFMYEICDRVANYSNTPKSEKVDKFTSTDISLIFSSFSTLKKNNKKFYNYLLECVNNDSDTYNVRDVAILYNSLTRLKVSNEFVFDSLNQVILSKLNSKISEKVSMNLLLRDISLLLNALLELNMRKVKDIFVKCSLILSSRIKYISNLHTLTLLLYSYSRLSYTIDADSSTAPALQDCKKNRIIQGYEKRLTVSEYEYIILTDVTMALLSKCSDLLLQMRPTDLLYFYRSFLNLFFNSPESKRNIYSNVVKLYKVHNQILQVKLEFQTRELLTLLQLLKSSYDILLDNKCEMTTLEIYKNNLNLVKKIKDELVYRVKVMSIADCINFMSLLDKDDHNIELLFRRLYDKLNRETNWESYTNKDLFAILDKVAQRAEKYVSDNMKMLVGVIIKKTSRIIKLKELCSILETSSVLGIKSNSLFKKLATLECRCYNLDPEQIFIAFHNSVLLGYVEVADNLMPHLFKVTDPSHSALLLLDLASLEFNSLRKVNTDTLEHLNSNIRNASVDRDDSYRKSLLTYFSYFNIANIRGSNGKINTNNSNISSCDDANSPYEDNSDGLDVDFMRLSCHYVDSNLNVVEYKSLLDEFIEDFGVFISKFDAKSRLKRDVKVGGFIFPAAVEADSKIVAIVPLFDDFYMTNSKMLKLSKYTQLRLLDYLQIKHMCIDLQNYRTQDDKNNALANILQQTYTLLNKRKNKKETTKIKNTEYKVETTLERNTMKHLNNFDRFRMLVSTTV
ncbi:conserved hypothetical protein [Theileria orientalis strain Shintoku]|uniref:Uncharacterized protein n=1 Tax=Theileria orientalis strain Shintoku TaxID=869250 RepID=J4DP70_THEOR|nr:conserved hypothetical protein [Theileria orientalis strain Shintoku]BAM40194.1 conserved hypothetical protein [Theileria orientalis strain Shintoku]|eukprot:XP_009690495.1 conserved hypothetical protein [Theileria orientalis strain Shintoku]